MSEGTWYRAGLVSLANGSDLVAGVGTEFIANVLPGAIFFAPEGLYEVERAVSDTQLKLVEPYTGPTVAGAEFAIAPTQGAVVQATKQLQAFLSELGPLKQAWETGELEPKGLTPKGVKDTVEDLPAVGNLAGDCWLVDGVLYMWTGSAWSNQGSTVTTPELEDLRDQTIAAKVSAQEIATTFGDVAGAVGAATTQASASAASAGVSLIAQVGAELARDVALQYVGIVPTLAAGLAATNGSGSVARYFSMVAADASVFLILYLNNAGAAVEAKRSVSIEGMFGFKATLAAGASLNTAIRQGIYFGAAGGNFLDLPAGYGNLRNVILEVNDITGMDGRWKLQRLVRWDKLDESWSRLIDTTGVGTSAWIAGLVPGDLSVSTGKLGDGAATRVKLAAMFSYVGPLDGTSDVNTLIASGIYLATARPLNAPAAAGGSGYLTVESCGNFVLQTWRDLTTPTSVWVRYTRPNNAFYGTWVSGSGVADNSVGRVKLEAGYSYGGALSSAATDLNAITATGIYLATARPLNTPSGSSSTGYVIVENCSNGSFVIQTWRNLLEPTKGWMRYIRPGMSVYGEWSSLTAGSSPFAGKKLVCFGDSLTEFHNYPARIAARLGLTAYNVGFGGCRMAKHTDARYDSMSMYRLAESVASGDFSNLIAQAQLLYDQTVGTPAFDDNRANAALLASIDFSTVDIVTIFYGTNDPYGTPPIPIGTNADTTGATFKGAINITIQKLLEKNPKMQVRFVTPTYRARQIPDDGKDSDHFPNSIGLYLKDYRDAIIEVCNAAHLPVIDAFITSGINAYNITAMTFDGLHRQEAGIERDGNTIAAGILATC